jgi:hypothetical protein
MNGAILIGLANDKAETAIRQLESLGYFTPSVKQALDAVIADKTGRSEPTATKRKRREIEETEVEEFEQRKNMLEEELAAARIVKLDLMRMLEHIRLAGMDPPQQIASAFERLEQASVITHVIPPRLDRRAKRR